MHPRVRAALLALALVPATVLFGAYGIVSAMEVLGAVDALGAAGVTLNLALLGVELLLGGFGLALLWTLHVPRGASAPPPALARDDAPEVAVLVPVRNEPADVLARTLDGLTRAQAAYPGAVDVVVLDDTAPGPDATALEAAARAAGARYVRRPTRHGYKAGALNAGLAATTAPMVAVLDVDHVPRADWLVHAVPALAADEGAAYVQGKLAWRNADAPIRRLAGMLQTHFYEVIQREKGARGAAVFAGSGCVFRRSRLDQVGGFPTATLVEDFDLTARLLTRGARGLFLDRVVASGLLPWTAADVARQLWRWAHGTTRLVPLRFRELATGAASWRVRFPVLVDALAYLGAGLFVVAGALLAAAGLAGVPLVRAMGAGPAPLMAPLLVLAAHVVTGAVALHRAGERGIAWVFAYHVVSLAYTPVVFAASFAGLLGLGHGSEGRVAKRAGDAAARPAGGVGGALGVAFGLGGLLVAASVGFLRADHWMGWWSLELGVAFLLPFVAVQVEALRAGRTVPHRQGS